MKLINYLSLFSGIGAFEKAMKNLKIPFNLVAFSEIDKYAVKSYCAIHNVSESLNLGDITKVDEKKLPRVDFITYGFPCQDISLAGKQQGLLNDDGTKTRSGLFFDALRIIEHTQPGVAIAENVKNLTSKKFNAQFQVVLASLESVGYNNYWAVLNSKDYGVPQNRDRVFIVSIRKDVDTGIFEFPESYPLKLRLKDMLEDKVNEKFYLSDIQIQKLQLKSTDALVYDKSMIGFEKTAREYTDVMPTITSREWKEPRVVNENKLTELNTDKVMQIGNCRPTKNRVNPNQGRVYDVNGISPCLNTMGGGNREPHVIESVAVWDGYNQRVRADSTTVGTLTRNCGADLKRNGQGIILTENNNLRIRKLTPKECFRLMGFKDEDFEKAASLNSNTQLYKQAGNSIVVDVAEELLCMLFDEEGNFFI